MSRQTASIVGLVAAHMLLAPAVRAQPAAAIPHAFTPANARICFTHLLAQAGQVTPPAQTVTLPNGIVVEQPVPDKYSYTDLAKGYWCGGQMAHTFTFGPIAKLEQRGDPQNLFLADIKPLPQVRTLDTQIIFTGKDSRSINVLLQDDKTVDLLEIDSRSNGDVKTLEQLKAALSDDMPAVNAWRAVANGLRRYAARPAPAPFSKNRPLKLSKS